MRTCLDDNVLAGKGLVTTYCWKPAACHSAIALRTNSGLADILPEHNLMPLLYQNYLLIFASPDYSILLSGFVAFSPSLVKWRKMPRTLPVPSTIGLNILTSAQLALLPGAVLLPCTAFIC